MGSAELLVSICRNDEDGEDGRAPMGAVSHTKSIPPGRGLVWKMELGGGGGRGGGCFLSSIMPPPATTKYSSDIAFLYD